MNAWYGSSIRKGRWGVLAAAVCALCAACGDDGATGPAGPAGTTGVPVTDTATALTVTVTGVAIHSPPLVSFTVTNQGGTRFVGLTSSQIRFTLAKLVPGTDGNSSAWQSYVNRTEAPGGVGPGTATTIQSTYDNTGTFVSNGDGTYAYTFNTDVTNVTSPLAVSYQPTLTHRLGIQISGAGVPVTNATYDWRPSDGTTTGLDERDIVQTASCNECHGKLAVHGGGRVETKYCVTCHNPGSTDANSGNTVDFKVMIHKIHRGENLPSVVTGTPYVIYGFNNSVNDFSDVVFPQDIRNCSKCHNEANAATPQAHNWHDAPSVEACGACHDDVNFSTGQGHSPSNIVAQNGQCTICHGTNSSGGSFAGTVQDSHVIPGKVAGAKYAMNIISVTNTGPGQSPSITYEVVDPTNNNARYNILNAGDPVWSGASVSLLIGWSTTDYHNKGNGSSSTPASAVTLNGKAASSGNNAAPLAVGDGTFQVTSLRAIPVSITGSGVVGMTARAKADFDGNGTYTDNVPIKSVVKYFAITDALPVARRSVVDIVNQCDDCHDQLTLHGESRTDEPQLCVICHNPRNTDIARRPKNGDGTVNVAATVDGLKEQSIDFKRMIHGIHSAAKRENPFVVYGFGGSVNNFSTVRFPGVLNNCRTCHKPNTFTLPLGDAVQASTVDTGDILSNPGYIADQTDDLVTTRTSAVCSMCHDSSVARTHMEQNGAQFSILVTNSNNDAETCEVCHGPGRLADVAEVHSVTP